VRNEEPTLGSSLVSYRVLPAERLDAKRTLFSILPIRHPPSAIRHPLLALSRLTGADPQFTDDRLHNLRPRAQYWRVLCPLNWLAK
jgi:hypothetical protein